MPKVKQIREARKDDPVLGALRAFVASVVRQELGAAQRPRSARIADVGITVKQLPTFEAGGVRFDKDGKGWTVDLATLEAYRARRRERRAAASPANDGAADPLDGIDPDVAAAVRRAVGGR